MILRALKNCSTNFVDIDDALAKGKGDVLTIDDARIGGFSALLVAEYGHYVSLFSNPAYMKNPYLTNNTVVS